jgi:predicted nucleic acid-binding protein
VSLTVVYDANVLHPAPVRDLLIRLAQRRTLNVRARWTEKILDEMVDSILARRPDLSADRLRRTRSLMLAAVPDCLVTGWEPLVASLELPDPDDRHVLAAAIRCHAQVIVTYNVDDFPEPALEPFDIAAQHPDDFVAHLVELAPAVVIDVLGEQVRVLRDPPTTVAELIDALRERHALIRTATMLEEQVG